MPNRVTFAQINDLVQTNLQANYQKLSRLQEQLSSGKRLTRPSDGPVDITNDLQLRSTLEQLTQFKRNIDDGVSYMAVLESTMVGTNNLYQRTRELAIQASNDTNTDQERQFILNEVSVLLDSLVASSNQTFKGEFIFSGTNTKVQPYELRGGRDVIDSSQVPSSVNASDNVLDPFAPLPQTIQIRDISTTSSILHQPNPYNDTQSRDILPGSLSIPGLSEGTDYEVDYVKGTITFLPTTTTFIPGVQGGAGANLTNAQIMAAVPAGDPGITISGKGIRPPRVAADPAWPGPPSPQPGGGIELNYSWIRRAEADLTGVIKREIEPGVTSQINTNVDDLFGSLTEKTSWDAMIELMQGLHRNDGPGIRDSLDGLNVAFTRSLDAQSTAGARTNRLDLTLDRNEEFFIETTRLHSELEDVDFAKVISEFVLQESIYTASLQSGARVIQPTLANFL